MNIKKIVRFLQALDKNNTKEYFDSVRADWGLIKTEVIEFTSNLIHDMSEFDSDITLIDPKSTLYRINRDTRFSKDKRPYKQWIAVGITPQKKSDMKPTYYFHIDHKGGLELGAGAWGVKPEDTKILRNAILTHSEEFKEVINLLEAQGYSLAKQFKRTRIPNGYSKDHELSEYVKFTSFAVDAPRKIVANWTEKELHHELLTFFHITSPLVLWARKALRKKTVNA